VYNLCYSAIVQYTGMLSCLHEIEIKIKKINQVGRKIG